VRDTDTQREKEIVKTFGKEPMAEGRKNPEKGQDSVHSDEERSKRRHQKDKTRHNRTGQDKTRHNKTRQDKTRQRKRTHKTTKDKTTKVQHTKDNTRQDNIHRLLLTSVSCNVTLPAT
jgi:hypothetical protein